MQCGSMGMDRLLSLYKVAWESERIPEDWTRGIILPFWKKKGSRAECGNYRGISLLSVPVKVLAHIILARIKATLLTHRQPQQSGFTPGRSTEGQDTQLNHPRSNASQVSATVLRCLHRIQSCL